jgi:hypothetical protein
MAEGLKSTNGQDNRPRAQNVPLTVTARRIFALARSICSDVGRPPSELYNTTSSHIRFTDMFSTNQITGGLQCSTNRGITQGLPEFFPDLIGYSSTQRILTGRIEWWQVVVRTSLWDEDLVLGHVCS